jgi:penicillin-binding protein activator
MNIKKCLPIILCPALLFATGCATTVKRVDPGGRDTITTTGIDQKDWNAVTDEVINSLRDFVNNTNLKAAPGKPALLAISSIPIDAGIHIQTENLTKRIREALLATGKVATLTTIGIGRVEDPIAVEERDHAMLLGIEPNRPDYTLSGRIIERRTRLGDITQYVYVFQLSLTQNPDGFAVWEKEKQTDAKQIKRGGVRF